MDTHIKEFYKIDVFDANDKDVKILVLVLVLVQTRERLTRKAQILVRLCNDLRTHSRTRSPRVAGNLNVVMLHTHYLNTGKVHILRTFQTT